MQKLRCQTYSKMIKRVVKIIKRLQEVGANPELVEGLFSISTIFIKASTSSA